MDPGGRTGCENIVLQLSIKFIKNDGELPFSMLFIDLRPIEYNDRYLEISESKLSFKFG